jgi:HD-GYP domain-containing protein (c-di-GMP phosphodiesterase class II)
VTPVKRIPIDHLRPRHALERSLYHHSGIVVLESGESLTREDITAMKRLGISELIELGEKDDRMEFLKKCSFRELNVDMLPEGKVLTKPLTDPGGNVILEENTEISPEVKESLKKRGMKTVYVRKSPSEMETNSAREFRTFHTKLVEARITKRVNEEIGNLDVDESTVIINPRKEISIREVEKNIAAGGALVKPSGPALRSKMIQRPKKQKKSESAKESFIEVQNTILKDVTKLFTHFKERDLIDGSFVGNLSKSIIGALIRDKDLLLNLLNMRTDAEYLVSHSMNVAIIAVNIATALRYSSTQVLEVGYAALLHDVGMYRISDKILQKPGKLTQSEFLEVQKHTNYNLEYLQRVKRIPASAPMVAYQVHERLNRTGYPKKRSGNLIHSFAKIIAVADIYSALTSDRPYRKALSPFRAARTVVDLGVKHEIDADIIRHFLQFVCLFPIGSWVRLNNTHVGKVISANEEDYTRPVINVMYDRNLNPIKHYLIDLREEQKLGIVDGLPSDPFLDTSTMEGF